MTLPVELPETITGSPSFTNFIFSDNSAYTEVYVSGGISDIGFGNTYALLRAGALDLAQRIADFTGREITVSVGFSTGVSANETVQPSVE